MSIMHQLICLLVCITGVAAGTASPSAELAKLTTQANDFPGDSIVTSFLEFQRAKPIRVLVIFWMTLAASTDLFIAGLLVWFLVRSLFAFAFLVSVLKFFASLYF